MTIQYLHDDARAFRSKSVFQPARAQIAKEMRGRLYLRQDEDEDSRHVWERR